MFKKLYNFYLHSVDTTKLFLQDICMIYGLVLTIIGIAMCISVVITNSKAENLGDNVEVKLIIFLK